MIRRGDVRQLGVFLGRFARPHWYLLLLSVVLSVLAALLATVQPLVLAPALDAATASGATAAASWREVSLNNVGPTLLAWVGTVR